MQKILNVVAKTILLFTMIFSVGGCSYFESLGSRPKKADQFVSDTTINGTKQNGTKNKVEKIPQADSSIIPSYCSKQTKATKNYWELMNSDEEGTQKISTLFNAIYKKEDSRSLMVFIDGTGNIAASNTNIWKLYSLASQQACDTPIIPYYHQGLGTTLGNKLVGSLSGIGIDEHIKDTYQFLAETYKPGDKIYIFGFSRGAYTARALNGMIEYVGLLDTSSRSVKNNESEKFEKLVEELFDFYQKKNDGEARFSDRLRKNIEKRTKEFPLYRGEQKVTVNAIGVFDTVAALGVGRDDNPDVYRTNLYAQKGYHALALDEQRNDFRPLRFDDRIASDQQLSEVWFAGAHADVGGGYHDDRGLSNLSLQWMLKQFSKEEIFPKTILKLNCIANTDSCELGVLHDEFLENPILFGKLGLHWRYPKKNETLHRSILCRSKNGILPTPNLKREPEGYYRPENVYLPLEKNYEFSDYQCGGK